MAMINSNYNISIDYNTYYIIINYFISQIETQWIVNISDAWTKLNSLWIGGD